MPVLGEPRPGRNDTCEVTNFKSCVTVYWWHFIAWMRLRTQQTWVWCNQTRKLECSYITSIKPARHHVMHGWEKCCNHCVFELQETSQWDWIRAALNKDYGIESKLDLTQKMGAISIQMLFRSRAWDGRPWGWSISALVHVLGDATLQHVEDALADAGIHHLARDHPLSHPVQSLRFVALTLDPAMSQDAEQTLFTYSAAEQWFQAKGDGGGEKNIQTIMTSAWLADFAMLQWHTRLSDQC